MFNKKPSNQDYKYCTEHLKRIIFNLAEKGDSDLHNNIMVEVGKKLNEIDKQVNNILRKSFINYCLKKRLDPSIIISSIPVVTRGKYHEKNVEKYDFIHFINLELKLVTMLHETEYRELIEWEGMKLKYMAKEEQMYHDLEGTYSLINGLKDSIDSNKY